jgi:mevalonate kinase
MSPVDPPRPLAVGTAPGKLILFGEHAVVYGHTAIAAAVGLRSTVSLWAHDGPTHIRLSSFDDFRLRRAVSAALPAHGLAVDIGSELPPGRGMGSSASIAVAMVRAAAVLAGEQPDHDTLFERSLALERIFHGHPSGVDNAVALRGGLLRYRRGPPLELEPLQLSRPLHLVVLDSGSPGSTAELVAAVRAARPRVDRVLDAIGRLAEQAVGLLDDPRALGEAMNDAHAMLKLLGVSTPRLSELCRLARDAGALGAKLSGAGGGGVVVALAQPDTVPTIITAAQRRGVPAFAVQVPIPTASLEPA